MNSFVYITTLSLLLLFVTTAGAAQPETSELYQRLHELRQNPTACGISKPAALHVNPKLEEAARHRFEGKTLSEALNIAGYGEPYAKVLVVGGGTINQVIERLQQRHCEDIANPEYAEIGAVWAKKRWWIVLAFGQEQAAPANAVKRIASQPDATPVNPSVFLALVNKARTEARRCGSRSFNAVHPLQWQSKLAAAAAVHARDISSKGEFSHTGSDGSQVSDRVRREGYDYRAVGENIAMNPMGIAATVESWLNSPGHCANIMNPDFTELGAAIEGSYSVMVFGR